MWCWYVASPLSISVIDLIHFYSGIELTPEEVYAIFLSLLSVQPVEGWSALPNVINAAKAATKLRWASPLDVKNAADRVFTEKFGPRETSKPKPKVCDFRTFDFYVTIVGDLKPLSGTKKGPPCSVQINRSARGS